MTKAARVGLSLLTMLLGWLSIGIGYTTAAGHPTSTVLFLLGIGLFIGGLINVIIVGQNKGKRTN